MRRINVSGQPLPHMFANTENFTLRTIDASRNAGILTDSRPVYKLPVIEEDR